MSRLKVIVVPVTPLQQNCSLVIDTETHKAAVVDPGGDVPAILNAITKAGVTVEKILLTHGHIDHAGGAAELRQALDVPVEGPAREDDFLLQTLPETGVRYGIMAAQAVTPDRWLNHDDTVTVGGLSFRVIHAPGHSPGSVVYFDQHHKFAVMGDVLFQGSIGRTDLPRGSYDQLMTAIRTRILTLGDEVVFLPGHGPASQIGHERASNPYVLEMEEKS